MNNNTDLALLQVFYDSKNLKNLLKTINNDPIISLFIVPYYSLFCAEAPKVLSKFNIKLPSSFKSIYSENDIRIKLKIFEDKYKKSEDIIKKCDYIQDFIFKNKLLFKSFSYLNLYYNIGVYIIDDKIIGNTQYAYYIFQDSKLLKLSNDDLLRTEFELIPKEIKEYGAYCSEMINIISYIGDKFTVKVKNNNNPIRLKIKYKNLNTNTLFKNTNYKYINLYILHILCNLNYVYYVVQKIDKNEYGLFMRIYYITYYYSIAKLENLKNYITSNNINSNELDTIFEFLPSISSFKDSEFRSCMMHYEFNNPNKINKNIKKEYLNYNKLLFGLVESIFDGITYEELKNSVLNYINSLATVLEKYLKIDISKSTDI